MLRHYSNVVDATQLTEAASQMASTILVSSAAGFPPLPFTIGVNRGEENEEVMLVTGRTGQTLTVTRGWDGTSARDHSVDSPVEHCVCARDYSDANSHIHDVSRHDHTQYLRLEDMQEFLPRYYQGVSQGEELTLNTTYRRANSLTVPSAPFPRRAVVSGIVSVISTRQDQAYTARLSRGDSVTYAAQILAANTYLAFSLTWGFLIEANQSALFTMDVRRNAGSGGWIHMPAGSENTTNRLSAIVFPHL